MFFFKIKQADIRALLVSLFEGYSFFIHMTEYSFVIGMKLIVPSVGFEQLVMTMRKVFVAYN